MSEWKKLNGIVEVAEAIAAGMDIEVQYSDEGCWMDWHRQNWSKSIKYRARPRKPKIKLVKSLCWRHEGGSLIWNSGGVMALQGYKRFPAGDIEGEVEA